ncbi:MAG: hypothetical protein KME18_16070 [Phormidium tanganyikae FI6-MK23]|nr:hypothetical protein [Phormidium tanganyikae FI6-MK23]
MPGYAIVSAPDKVELSPLQLMPVQLRDRLISNRLVRTVSGLVPVAWKNSQAWLSQSDHSRFQ